MKKEIKPYLDSITLDFKHFCHHLILVDIILKTVTKDKTHTITKIHYYQIQTCILK